MGGLASPQVIGRYALYGKIASGGMATVHFGRLLGAAGFARTVAVKRLHPHLADDPEFLATMIDEARLAARIHHPNVVPTLDVVADGGELLVVMEYVRGESLSRLLRTSRATARPVPLPVASAIVIGALHGLHAAHQATSDRGAPLGIVHRDVSPQNILVGVDGMARVIDFGVAKAAGRLQTTREGSVKGKMAYMAPELLAAREATQAVDVYAMGVVLWETLAGRRLFEGDSEGALYGLVRAGAREPPSRHAPNLPAALDALVMCALSLDPGDRFATAKDMAELLLRVVPPAFPTDVGVWVEEVAGQALGQRGVALAEIESSSGVGSVPPPLSAPRLAARAERASAGRTPARETAGDDTTTVASQPSSLAVEAPKSSVAVVWRSRRARLAVLLGAAVVLAAGVAVLAWRGGGTPSSATAGASAQPTASASAQQALAREPPPTSSASASAVAPALSVATAAATTAAATTTVRPATTVARPRPVPKPAGSIRFAKPD
jgi:serine/threonine-protein kinase